MAQLPDHVKEQLGVLPQTYKVKIHCANCDRDFRPVIPKGTTVLQSNPICPNCGVDLITLRKEWKEHKV